MSTAVTILKPVLVVGLMLCTNSGSTHIGSVADNELTGHVVRLLCMQVTARCMFFKLEGTWRPLFQTKHLDEAITDLRNSSSRCRDNSGLVCEVFGIPEQ